MKSTTIIAISFIAVMQTGCATLVNGSRQDMTINTTPGNAIVEYSGSEVGKTPCTVKISRKSQTVVVIKADGYQPKTVTLEGSLSGWFWGNIISCGLYGSTTDAVSGSMYKYEPDSLHISLERIGGATASDDKGTKVKRFCLIYYKDIGRDISAEGGERIETLKGLMGQDAKTTSEFIKAISKDYAEAKNADEFGERMDIQSR